MDTTSTRGTSRWARVGAVGVAAIASALTVDLLASTTGAEDVAPTFDVVSHPGAHSSPRVSADGSIVVFETETAADEGDEATRVSGVAVHDRMSQTTVDAPDAGASRPGLSGDGCTVAYSVLVSAAESSAELPQAPPAEDDTIELRVLDRCADPAVPSVVALTSTADALGAPALSSDGAVIAVSDGDDVVRLARDDAGAYAVADVFDATLEATAEAVTGAAVDISADGSIVVYESGVGEAPFEPDPATSTVFAWRAATDVLEAEIEPVSAFASSPSLSSDGRLVAYEVRSPTDPTQAAGVAVRDRGGRRAEARDIEIATEGGEPTISDDGNHVVYTTAGGVVTTSWVGDDVTPFAELGTATVIPVEGGPAPDRTVVGAAAPSGSAAALAAVSVPVGDDPTAVDGKVTIYAVGGTSGFVDDVDLGTGEVGETLTGTLEFLNSAPASVVFDGESFSIEEPFVVTSNECVQTIRSGATCRIDVSVTLDVAEDVFGTATITSLGLDGAVYQAEVAALGVVPTTVATTTTTTTTVATTTTTTTPPTTVRTTRPRTTTRPTTRRTTPTTTEPSALPVFAPSQFEFAPTIVDAGRRVGAVEIVNSGSGSATIVGVRIDPVDDPAFAITSGTTCAGETLDGGERCVVEVEFAPIDEGSQSVQLIAQLGSGDEIAATVSGVGAPPPTLEFIPGVATSSQVVNIQGAGFPAGATVQLTWENVQRDVVVNDVGVFNVPLVVQTSLPAGPSEASVAGQPDLFADVTGSMIVTVTGNRANPAVLNGVGPNVSR